MKTAIFAVVAALSLTGCASPRELPDVMALKKPATPSAKVKATHFHPVVTGYVHRSPTSPAPWVTEDAPPATVEENQKEQPCDPQKNPSQPC